MDQTDHFDELPVVAVRGKDTWVVWRFPLRAECGFGMCFSGRDLRLRNEVRGDVVGGGEGGFMMMTEGESCDYESG